MPDAHSFPSQTPLFYAINRERYERQALIDQIQTITGRPFIVYVANFNHQMSFINGNDLIPFTELLHRIPNNSEVDFLIHSPGGIVDAAEALVNALLTKASKVRVFVPHSAKSAATMISLVADEIHMGPYSELGPIDPQITLPTINGPVSSPALAFIKGLEKIAQETLLNNNNLNAAYYPLLQGLNPGIMQHCQMSVQHGLSIAQRWLERSMFGGRPQEAQALAERLMDVNLFPSHGAAINAERAIGMGLNVIKHDQNEVLWECVWRLFCLYDVVIKRDKLIKIFESANASSSL